MIQQQTIVKVTDNSGVKTAKCIKVIGKFKRKYARVGDFIIVSIQKVRNKFKNKPKVLKGDVLKALVVRANSKLFHKDGSNIIFNENEVVLLTKQGGIVATRVVGPLPKYFRKKRFTKLLSLSEGII